MKKPDHLENFPCMRPWIGSAYEDDRHKRLVVVAESHYMPPGSTIHLDPERWYQSKQDHLDPTEFEYVHTKGVIRTSFVKFYRGHEIFRAIGREIVPILEESGLTPDEFPLNHIAYYNYFMRPAPKTGGSIEGHVVPQDRKISEEVLRWFLRRTRRAPGSQNIRGSTALVPSEASTGTGHLCLPVCRWIRQECGSGMRHSVHQHASSNLPLVEQVLPRV